MTFVATCHLPLWHCVCARIRTATDTQSLQLLQSLPVPHSICHSILFAADWDTLLNILFSLCPPEAKLSQATGCQFDNCFANWQLSLADKANAREEEAKKKGVATASLPLLLTAAVKLPLVYMLYYGIFKAHSARLSIRFRSLITLDACQMDVKCEDATGACSVHLTRLSVRLHTHN